MLSGLIWKSERLLRVQKYLREVRELAATMGMEYSKIITDVHHSLDDSSDKSSMNISDAILERLDYTVNLLKEEKKKRMEKVRSTFLFQTVLIMYIFSVLLD